MDGSRPSRTALSAARHRATHQILEAGVVLADPLAMRILGESPRSLAHDARAHADRRTMRWFICARSHLAEDVAARSARAGVEQLVILGAGLDTFAYRNPHPTLAVVEVDHPATQRWKLGLLARAGIDVGPVRHVPVDFERDDLAAALRATIDVGRSVLFWWLGVTPYLSRTAVSATLAVLGALPSVAVVLDHASPVDDIPADEQEIHRRRRDRVAAVGEPWISDYRPAEIRSVALRNGFREAYNVDEVALIDRVVGRPPRPPRGRTHLLVATSGWPTAGTVANEVPASPGRAAINPCG